MGKLEKISAWNLTKVGGKKQVIDETRTSDEKVHFASLMNLYHLMHAEMEMKHQKWKSRSSCSPRWYYSVKDDFDSYAVLNEQGSLGLKMTTGKSRDYRILTVKGLFFSVYVNEHLFGKKQNLDPKWKVLNKEVDLGEPTSFLDHVYLGSAQRLWNKQRYFGQLQNHVRIANFRGMNKSFFTLRIFVFLHGPMTWKVVPRNVWNDIVSWQIRRRNDSVKYKFMNWWPSFQRRRKNLLENCQIHALKLF